jgi:hypothetical protein
METKFTPGPWFFTGSGLSRYVEGKVRPGVLQEVAWCGATEVSEQMEANARLIAAAPYLLAELQNIANANPSSWDEETRDQFQQWAQNRARAAIAKATGEA